MARRVVTAGKGEVEVDLTVEQWRVELERLSREQTDPNRDGYMTVDEIAQGMQRSSNWVRERVLQPLARAGRLDMERRSRRCLLAPDTIRKPMMYRVKREP